MRDEAGKAILAERNATHQAQQAAQRCVELQSELEQTRDHLRESVVATERAEEIVAQLRTTMVRKGAQLAEALEQEQGRVATLHAACEDMSGRLNSGEAAAAAGPDRRVQQHEQCIQCCPRCS